MIENHMPGNLYNELFSESSEEICTAFQSMSRSLIVYKNTIENWSPALQAFFSRSPSICIIYFCFL